MNVMSSGHSETDGESEGVWSPEIEAAFQEALKEIPPCGRRKHILHEEGGGRMYGRNELIARYIEVKTGQKRTRKQVSSHIQVLSRREARARTGSRTDDASSVSPASSINGPSSVSNGPTTNGQLRPDSATSGSAFSLNGNNHTSSMQIETTFNGHNHHLNHHLNHHQSNHHRLPVHFAAANQQAHHLNGTANGASNNGVQFGHHHHYQGHLHHHHHHHAAMLNPYEFWEDRAIMTRKIRLVEFSAFIEKRKLDRNPALSQATQAAVLAASLTNSTTAAAAAALTNGAGAGGAPMVVDDGPTLTLPSRNGSGAGGGFVANNHSVQEQQYSQQHPQHTGDSLLTTADGGHLNLAASFQRHSFVKIDYRQLVERQANKMERIDIREVQDKFPDIGGPNGLVARSSSSDAFFLVKFWADLSYDSDQFGTMYEDQNSYFGFSNHFETLVAYDLITCSTKACSYGEQVVEKVEKVHSAFNSSTNTYSYVIDRSPMCEFMIQFIKKLRQLPELPLMNRILENFTVLQTVTCESTSEVLLCIAYVFEIASVKQTNGSHYHVYKLTRD